MTTATPSTKRGRFHNMEARLSGVLPAEPALYATLSAGEIKSKLEAHRQAKGLPVTSRHSSTVKQAAGQTAPAPKVPPAPKFSAEDEARHRRVARHDAVMGSPHARGRQRTAKVLLDAPQAWTAEQIIAALPTMLTDAQIDAKLKREAADAVWDKANAAVGRADSASTPKAKKQDSEDVWAKAWASVGRAV